MKINLNKPKFNFYLTDTVENGIQITGFNFDKDSSEIPGLIRSMPEIESLDDVKAMQDQIRQEVRNYRESKYEN